MDEEAYRQRIRKAYGETRQYRIYALILVVLLVVVFAGSMMFTSRSTGCTKALGALEQGYAVCCGTKGTLQECTGAPISQGSYVHVKADVSENVRAFGSDYAALCYVTNLRDSQGRLVHINDLNLTAGCAGNPYAAYGAYGRYVTFVAGYADEPAFVELYLLHNTTDISNGLKTGKRIFSWKGMVE